MSEHTKEPWVCEYMGSDESDVVGANDVSIICGSTGYMSDANARRIVACVNACTGISTETLELVPRFTEAGIKTVQSVESQRDAMRTALLEARAFISSERQSFIECSVDPQTHQLDPDDYAEADRITNLLARIDAALGEGSKP